MLGKLAFNESFCVLRKERRFSSIIGQSRSNCGIIQGNQISYAITLHKPKLLRKLDLKMSSIKMVKVNVDAATKLKN